MKQLVGEAYTYLGRLFCSRLDDNEVLFITGAERYSLHSGYGHTFKWKAGHHDNTSRCA
jgi:poly(ADP-ribose) glycohydrolase